MGKPWELAKVLSDLMREESEKFGIESRQGMRNP
jgi:hypothetical protein